MRHKKFLISIVVIAVLALGASVMLPRTFIQDARRHVPLAMRYVFSLYVPFEELKATEDIQVLTHFPHDFSQTLTSLPSLEEMDRIPFLPYFNPSFKIVGIGDWSFTNAHDSEGLRIIDDFVMENPNTPVYLVADAELREKDIQIWLHPDGTPLDRPLNIQKVQPLTGEVNGDLVYEEVEFVYWVTDDIRIDIGPLRMRKEIVDTIQENGGRAEFPGGTHIAYGMRDFSVHDMRVDMQKLPGTIGVNPFEYFTDEKQQELLEIYSELYGMYKEAGIFPYTDLTNSIIKWNEQGTIEGIWTRDDVKGNPYHRFDSMWEVISVVGIDKTNEETYWKVLDHPWNVENNLAGLFYDDFFAEEPTDQPLYDGNALGATRLYLLEGDFTEGVAMIIQAIDANLEEVINPEDSERADIEQVWRPWEPDGVTNHPSTGERRYLRFRVHPADDIWDEMLTIEGFRTEEEARAGFTDDAVLYRRDPKG